MVERYVPDNIRLQRIETELRNYGCSEAVITKHLTEMRATLTTSHKRDRRRLEQILEKQQFEAEEARAIEAEDRASHPRRPGSSKS